MTKRIVLELIAVVLLSALYVLLATLYIDFGGDCF